MVRCVVEIVLSLLLGGSWVVRTGVISKVTILITPFTGLITPLVSTHEPPSKLLSMRLEVVRRQLAAIRH